MVDLYEESYQLDITFKEELFKYEYTLYSLYLADENRRCELLSEGVVSESTAYMYEEAQGNANDSQKGILRRMIDAIKNFIQSVVRKISQMFGGKSADDAARQVANGSMKDEKIQAHDYEAIARADREYLKAIQNASTEEQLEEATKKWNAKKGVLLAAGSMATVALGVFAYNSIKNRKAFENNRKEQLSFLDKLLGLKGNQSLSNNSGKQQFTLTGKERSNMSAEEEDKAIQKAREIVRTNPSNTWLNENIKKVEAIKDLSKSSEKQLANMLKMVDDALVESQKGTRAVSSKLKKAGVLDAAKTNQHVREELSNIVSGAYEDNAAHLQDLKQNLLDAQDLKLKRKELVNEISKLTKQKDKEKQKEGFAKTATNKALSAAKKALKEFDKEYGENLSFRDKALKFGVGFMRKISGDDKNSKNKKKK